MLALLISKNQYLAHSSVQSYWKWYWGKAYAILILQNQCIQQMKAVSREDNKNSTSLQGRATWISFTYDLISTALDQFQIHCLTLYNINPCSMHMTWSYALFRKSTSSATLWYWQYHIFTSFFAWCVHKCMICNNFIAWYVYKCISA